MSGFRGTIAILCALAMGLALAGGSPTAASAQSASTKPAAAATPVTVRAADHGNFDRIVFDWGTPVSYTLQQKNNLVTVTFARAAAIDLAAARKELAADVTAVSAEPGGDSTTVVLQVPAGATMHHFAEGNRVVIDVQRAAANAKPEPQAQKAQTAQPTQTTQTTQTAQTATTAPPRDSGRLTPMAPTSPKKAAPTASETATPAAPAVATTASVPASPPAAGAQPVAAKAPGPTQTFSISVSWDQPVGAAIFQRAGYLWLVFDKHQDVDIKLLRRLGGDAVTFAEQLPSKAVTIVRLILQPDYKPSVRRDGLLWVIDLTGESSEPSSPIDVQAPVQLTNGMGMALGVKEPGNVIDFIDPEVGDTIVVVPVGEIGAGVYPGHDTPDLQLLATLQGVAIVPHTDAIDVKTSRSGVTVAMPGGSSMIFSASAAAPRPMTATGSGLFDVSGWRGGGDEDFEKAAKNLVDRMTDLSPTQVGPADLRAAQFYFSNGFAAECLGYLRLAATAEPTMVETAPFRSLRGACSFLMGRWADAQADLDNPLLKDDGEAQLWRATAHAAAINQPGEWDKPLAIGLPLIKNYPKQLKWPLAEVIAHAAIAAGDDGTARDAIEIMAGLASRGEEKSEVDYLTGALEELKGQFDRALANYDRAKDGDSREYRARAGLAQTELLLRTKKIKPKQAAERLDKLRFTWREGDFEFNLLRRLAELQTEAEEYPEALRTLRTISTNYSDNPAVSQVRQSMSDTFKKLYLQGAADAMQPVAAIGLYDEFRDLTPSGADGDEMIRKLADRLVKVDLLDRAAALLKYQVTYRLKSLDKARVGSQLALLDLLDKQPGDALDALKTSDVEGLPPELVEQRHHLQARALADVNRGAEAVALLKDDKSPEGAQLRIEILLRQKDWPNAADAISEMVPEPERGTKFSESQAQLVLTWATALTLGKDDRGLATLRRTYGPAMVGTTFQAAFDLLTSAPDKQVTDFPGLADKIKQAQAFKTFMASYKEKVQASGLSSIN